MRPKPPSSTLGHVSSPAKIPSVPALLLVASVAGACSNPVCSHEVVDRLLDECKLTFGASQAGRCISLPGAPSDMAELDERLDRHNQDQCEVSDPDGLDTDCLKTEDCEKILMGACDDDERTMSSTARQTCVGMCFDEVMACQESCSTGGTFDACLSCNLDCSGAYEDCVDACPD